MNKEEVKHILDTLEKDENIKVVDLEWFKIRYPGNYVLQHPDQEIQKYYKRRASIYVVI